MALKRRRVVLRFGGGKLLERHLAFEHAAEACKCWASDVAVN